MRASLFWLLFCVWYSAVEAMCLLFGSSILPRGWLAILPALVISTAYPGMVVEEWPLTRPKDTDTRWHSEFGVRGMVYPVPMILAVAGRLSIWLVVVSFVAYVFFARRLLWLRFRCLRRSNTEGGSGPS